MMGVPDGTYSIAAIGVGGASLLAMKIERGAMYGNDISGSRYSGTITPEGREAARVSLSIIMPPGTFGVWGTNPNETFQTRSFSEVIPNSAFTDREPYTIPGYNMTVMITPIPDEYTYLTHADWIAISIDRLRSLQRVWASYEA